MHNSHCLSSTNQQQQQFNRLHNRHQHHHHHQHRKHPNKREMMATSKSLSPSPLHLLLLLIIINLVDLPFPMFAHSSFIRETEKEYLLPQGFDLELPCQVNCHLSESVDCTWFANRFIKHPLPGKYDYAKTNSNGDCSLLIRNVSFPRDNGVWECQVLCMHRLMGPEFCKTNVIVLVEPSAPQIEELRIFANQTTNITCHIENGNPLSTLQWYLNGENISKNASSIAYSNQVLSTLSYTFEKKHNASTLVCKSSHPMQSQNSSFSLNVLYEPIVSVAQKMHTIIEGGNLEIDCAADSNPLANIYWERLFIVMGKNFASNLPSVDGKLRISGISHEMDGAILNCSAENIVGRSEPKSIKLNVLYFPILHEVIRILSGIVALGGEIRIECKFIGNPKPNVRWAFVDEIRNEEHPLPAGDNSELLAIKNVSYSNEGKYYCEGSNRIHGQYHKVRSTPFHVYVVGKPQFFVPKTTAAGFENENIRIEQEFCSDPAPTKVVWIYDSSVQHNINFFEIVMDDLSYFNLESGLGSSGGTNGSHIMAGPLVSMHRNRMDRPKCLRAALMLFNSTIADSRDYTLRVYNGKASYAEGVISLQVQSKHSGAI